MSETNVEQTADADDVENIENVEKADIVQKADVTNVEEDSDDDDFYTNFETFLSKSKSTTTASNLVESSTANNSSNEIDRQNLSEKVIDSSTNPDKVEVDLLMADIDNCLVENEVRMRLG